MTLRGRILLGLGLVIAVLLGWWFHSTFTWVREDAEAGYQGEALVNDFLAAQRLLQRTGHQAECLRALPATLPPPGDVLVLPRRGRPMARAQAARILAWVERGGLLLAAGTAPGEPGADALFGQFGARMVAASPSRERFAPWRFRLDDTDLAMETAAGVRIQAPGQADDDRAGPGDDVALLRRDLGEGSALLCTDLGCLDNRRIGRLDHADFLCGVADWRPGSKVWIVIRGEAPSAWGWLARNAWPALAALAALCLAGVWAAAPRFGPPMPDPEPARRSFLEHLDACGRYQWRADRGLALLAAAREAFRRRLVQVHPGWAALDPEPLGRRLAQASGLPPDRIARALHHPGPLPPAGFLEAMQTLHHLGNHL
ncbi:MAG: DUF4350 domain-containing protein [Holophaga sp.]|jgi:hypothetical protein